MAETAKTALHDVLRHLPVPVLICDAANGTILWANGQNPAGAGVSHPNQMVGLNLLDFVVPEEQATALEAIEAAASGRTRPAVFRVRRLDGGTTYVQSSAVPLVYEGRPAILAVTVDVTEREQALRDLADSEERYRQLVENVPQGIVVVAHRGTVVYANGALASALGCSAEEIAGRPYQEFVDPADRARVRAKRRQVLVRQRSLPPYEVTLLAADGTRLRASAHTSAVHLNGEAATQTVLTGFHPAEDRQD